MAQELIALNALGAIPTHAEVDKAAYTRNTLHHAQAVTKSGLPVPVAKWLLHQDYAARLAVIAKMAREIETALEDGNTQVPLRASQAYSASFSELSGKLGDDGMR